MYSKGIGNCTNCDPGQYRKSGDVATLCKNCEAGRSSEEGSSKCQTCNAGEFNDKYGGKCKRCPKDSYRPRSYFFVFFFLFKNLNKVVYNR